MKRVISGSFFTLLLTFFTITYSSQSQAVVGLFMKKQSVQTIGAIASGSGSAVFTAALVTATVTNASNQALGYIIAGAVLGPIISTIGLIILDENSNSMLEFQEIGQDSRDFNLYTSEEIEIYNSELEELNAIKNTIEEDAINAENSQLLWKQYSETLHPATVKIAQDKANTLLNILTHVKVK